jgi:ketosteroid isomerase-like protein
VKKQTLIGVLVVLAGLGGYLWWRLHPSEEKVVAKRVNQFAECVSKSEGEGNAAMALRMNSLPGFLADRVSIEVQSQFVDGTYDSSELASHIARARTMCAQLKLTFHDVKVAVNGPDTATATFTARLTARSKSGDSQSETREIHATLKKTDGKWRFTDFREEQVMVK